MEDQNTFKITPMMCDAIGKIEKHQEEIYQWLDSQEEVKELPLYSSVDIRDAGFKVSVVDTNLFPAGFNNLCEHGLEDAVKFMREAILKRVDKCERILIVAEEHTRNTWYLENVRILQDIISKAGFHVRIATFMSVQPAFCESAKSVELDTATGQTVKVYCFKRILADFEAGRDDIDLLILNNDLTSGIPDILKKSNVPIYPPPHAGWHSRLKSNHFYHAENVIREFAKIVGLDPWLFSGLFTAVDNVDINNDADRKKLFDTANELFEKIRAKYKEHNLNDKPYIVLKSDSGTYGMGVIPVEDPAEILTLNRRARNDLAKGKSSTVTSKYILQEGVPTIHSVDEQVSEVVIYQIENNLIGGFYRFNTQKGSRENLNSPGMGFKKMCPHLKKYGDCGCHHNLNVFDVYRMIARMAGIAAYREVVAMEAGR